MLTSIFPSVFSGFQGLKGVRIYMIFDEILRWRSGGSPGEVFFGIWRPFGPLWGPLDEIWEPLGALGGSIWGPVGLRLVSFWEQN